MFSVSSILRKYIYPWFQILSKNRNRVAYVDGFAGKGKFDTGEEGSPLIVLNEATRFLSRNQNKKILVLFVENNRDNFFLFHRRRGNPLYRSQRQ